MYENLRAEMKRKKVLISDLATALGTRRATVSDKINGKSRFYYDEASGIKKIFFPDCEIEYLFSSSDQHTV
ncbi:helix-turn-helix domain-containing protein [Paenibacillus macquariensis]|uniref:DNA-binding protein n=1 Tax=Paenibacillus macquariensis TaxID=948756 RepID=A0ABY1JS02_9BACL|nr:helix-turn-helix transcriptional regulator [Paenibacillus macquariensis]MEC0092856.1 helix-turn-helix transcriptional regulator [Paenibacillus macquariensis]OAB36235.1 DNA-binding protein [Paenibacillus macquariensis subsp. macquariensis]SIQ67621.1 hypothetical protein SAMN05421578_103311 [Paenibacillus macquariensis]